MVVPGLRDGRPAAVAEVVRAAAAAGARAGPGPERPASTRAAPSSSRAPGWSATACMRTSPAAASGRTWCRGTGASRRRLGWLADLSGLPGVAKGVLRADDARTCVDAGAAGRRSTHGGRCLTQSISSADALPEIAAAVGDRARLAGTSTAACGHPSTSPRRSAWARGRCSSAARCSGPGHRRRRAHRAAAGRLRRRARTDAALPRRRRPRPPEPGPGRAVTVRVSHLSVDSRDAYAQSRWWAEALGLVGGPRGTRTCPATRSA